jgi:hypothetical protein
MDTVRLYAQFPAPPISVTPALSPLRNSTSSNPNPTATGTSRTAGLSAYPTTSLRTRTQEDLNRLVSGSTASGTTHTSESFVKHPGPAHIMRIAPEDVPALPDRVGGMVFDRLQMRWVKTAGFHTRNGSASEGGYAASAEGSEDPFRDIESLRDDDSQAIGTVSVIDNDAHGGGYTNEDEYPLEEVDDEEEAELTSFSFDGPPAHELPMAVGGTYVDEETDTEDEDVSRLAHDVQAELTIAETAEFSIEVDDSFDDAPEDPPLATSPQALEAIPSSPFHSSPAQPLLPSTPLPPSRRAFSALTPIRSALKNASLGSIPFSGLRDPSAAGNKTPANRARHHRSVSFSDGKRDGPIRGLGRVNGSGDTNGDLQRDEDDVDTAGPSFVPSARSKRIIGLMEGLEGSSKRRNST